MRASSNPIAIGACCRRIPGRLRSPCAARLWRSDPFGFLAGWAFERGRYPWIGLGRCWGCICLGSSYEFARSLTRLWFTCLGHESFTGKSCACRIGHALEELGQKGDTEEHRTCSACIKAHRVRPTRQVRPHLGTSREPQVKYRQESHGTEIPTNFDEARA